MLPPAMSVVSQNLAQNIRQLRERTGLSQQQIATVAQLPRPTWANLESGDANPTVSVLTKVAAALAVGVEELIAAPPATARHYPAVTLPSRKRGKVTVRSLLAESAPGLELERIALPQGSNLPSLPHGPGTREYLVCEIGELELVASGRSFQLSAGDVLVFRGDQRHSYKNVGQGRAVAYTVVTLAGGD